MRLDHLEEHDWTSFPRFPWLIENGEEEFVATPPGRLRVPLSFTLLATRVYGTGGRPGAQSPRAGSSGLRIVQPAPDTLRGLVEEAAVRAGERDLLVGAHPALLELLLVRGGLHDVVPAVVENGHDPFCPKPDGRRGQWGSVGPVDPTPSTEGPPATRPP